MGHFGWPSFLIELNACRPCLSIIRFNQKVKAMKQPVADATDEARALARRLLGEKHASLAYVDDDGPGISRIAFGLDATGCPMTLVSSLTAHAVALRAHAPCAVMLGDPGGKGDPLTHPRLMLRVLAEVVDKAEQRDHWLKGHPKAALYLDFTDFAFVRLRPVSGLLNGGFGKAWRLTPEDLA
jgi:putative heme iron utilization protein